MFFGKKAQRANKKIKPSGAGQRRRLFVTGLKLGLVAAVVFGAAYGTYSLYAELKRTPSLEIKTVLVKGRVRVTDTEAVELAGIRPGLNMLSFSVGKAEAGLKGHPFVKEAKVTRRFPDTVEIEITEHAPVALVKSDELYVMDDEGELFKKYSTKDALDLPVVTSFVGAGEWDGAGYREKLLNLLAILKKEEGFKFAGTSEIRVEPVYGFSIITIGDGIRVELGAEGFEEKFGKLKKVVEARNGDFKGVESIDLNNDRGVIVKFGGTPRKEGGIT